MPAPDFIAPTQKPHTYTGVCRCKANKFKLETANLTGTTKCDCSICTVNDLFSWFGNVDQLVWERKGGQTVYQYGEKKIRVYFCDTCGNQLYAEVPGSEMCAVNLRMLQDVDLWSLNVDKAFEGSKLDPQYEPPPYSGPGFTDTKAGTETYHGSCHCGAVTIALRSKPLNELVINECNCAYCWKAARVHVYPQSEEVHLGGAEKLAAYKISGKPEGTALFCKHCGVAMLQVTETPPKDTDGVLVPSPKESLGHEWTVNAVNIRVLRGVDVRKLVNVNRYNGRANDPQFVAD